MVLPSPITIAHDSVVILWLKENIIDLSLVLKGKPKSKKLFDM